MPPVEHPVKYYLQYYFCHVYLDNAHLLMHTRIMARTLIPHNQLAEYLREHFSARQIADTASVTTQYAYDMLKGKSTPSRDILKDLGIEVLYEAVK